MSTRANIILKEGKEKLFFYRHSDGYPSGTLPTLNKFIEWMKEGKIRNDLSQGAGWLIILGAIEYGAIPEYKTEKVKRYGREYIETVQDSVECPKDWKVGAYEPTTALHGDIEYLYTIDMNTLELTVQNVHNDHKTGKQTFTTVTDSHTLVN